MYRPEYINLGESIMINDTLLKATGNITQIDYENNF